MTTTRAVAIGLAALVASAAAAQGTMTWTYGYDPEGNRTVAVDPVGNQSTFSYDPLQRRTSIVQPPPSAGVGAPRIGIGYDGASNVASMLDPRNLSTTYASDAFGNVWSRRSPDSGLTGSTYDAAGNLIRQTDARGKSTTYTYDALNRLRTVGYATGVGITYEYDGGSSPTPGSVGKLTRMTDESGATTFLYDALGKLTSRTQSIDGTFLVMRFAWGTSGSSTNRVVGITYPSGAVIGYGYDAGGRVESISASGMLILSGVTYNGDNHITGWVWANGTSYARTYDVPWGRLASYPLGTVTRTLTYDDAGRITGFSHSNAANNQAFAYDADDRLIQQTTPTTSYAYGYDATGNRTAYRVGSVTLINMVSPSSNQLASVQRLVGSQVVSYAQAYDAAGALIADGGQTSTYSDRGRRATTTSGATTTYRYNGFDERVSKSGAAVPSGAAYYSYNPAGLPVGEYDAGLNVVSETVYLGTTPVAVLKQVGPRSGQNVQLSVNNVFADHIDTPRVVTNNTSGAVLWQWDAAEPFGNSAPNENPSGLGTFTYDHRMPGQMYDSESGLVYNLRRDYRTATGSYAQSDPIGLAGGINTYGYAGGGPIQNVDPTGELFFVPFLVGAATGALIDLGLQLLANGGDASCIKWTDVGISAALGGVGGELITAPLKIYQRWGLATKGAAETTAVIGRVSDLQKLSPGEKSLLDRLPNLGNPKANWKQNAGVLRQEMQRGLPIRDASPLDTTGQYLNAERSLLLDRGWTLDRSTNFWMPPKP